MNEWSLHETTIAKMAWANGDSATVISRSLASLGYTRTRNAVMGKLMRIGVIPTNPPRLSTPPKFKKVKGKPKQIQPPTFRPQHHVLPGALAAIRALAPIEPGLGVALIRPGQCRFACGDPKRPDFAFCGRPSGDSSWCHEHRKLVFQPRAQPTEAALKRATHDAHYRDGNLSVAA